MASMHDDRDPIPPDDAVPEGAGGLTDRAGDPGRSPQRGNDPGLTVGDLPAPRAPGPAPSQGSVGAMNADPTIDHDAATPAPAEPNPTAPEALDPGVMPRDDTPPVGSSPASATGAILSQEDTANPTDPDGPDESAESDVDGLEPDDTPDDPGLAESPSPGTPPLA